MVKVRQAVNHRDRAVCGEAFNNLVAKGANDEAVQVARHDTRSVANTFAAADLSVLRIQDHREAAEFIYADFKGNPCAGAALEKEKAPRLKVKSFRAAKAACLHIAGQMKNLLRLVRSEIGFF